MPIGFDEFFADLRPTRLSRFEAALRDQLARGARESRHGNETVWDAALAALPRLESGHFDPGNAAVTIGAPAELPVGRDDFCSLLKTFMPWRKGPWRLFGVDIDTEWRSDWKWARLRPHIAPLAGRLVLDVGSGNGYYLFRMLAEGANLALGVDPTLLYLYQFNIARRFAPPVPVHVLPLRSEQLPPFGAFDTVFSLGVLYHRRSPMEHLEALMSFLRPGGELVMETLVVDGDATTVLEPPDRYAKMANVRCIPSTNALETWLWRSGFQRVRTVDVTPTTTDEQRATAWMTFQSLADFLNPDNPQLTVEGLPAPCRAILVAEKAR